MKHYKLMAGSLAAVISANALYASKDNGETPPAVVVTVDERAAPEAGVDRPDNMENAYKDMANSIKAVQAMLYTHLNNHLTT